MLKAELYFHLLANLKTMQFYEFLLTSFCFHNFRRHLTGTNDISFDFSSQIYVAEFSPYEWSQDLICIGTENTVVIGAFVFPVSLFLTNPRDSNQILSILGGLLAQRR